MSGLDGRIMVIGLPTVAALLHADAEQAIWFTQAYTIGSTVFLLFLGRVSDMYGRVKIYNLGFAIFTVGSLLTSLSNSPDFFIASRLFQGLGSAALFSNSAAIITDAFPTGELGKALGINSVAFRAGSMLGLTVSGLILSVLDWRFLFYINIPVGIFGTVWAHKRLTESKERERRTPMDWFGFVTFTSFMATFLLALTYAAYGIGESYVVIVFFLGAAVSLLLFVLVELKSTRPLLDLSLLKIREFTGGVVTQLINAMAWGAFSLMVSLYLQLIVGYSPLQAGLAILPFEFALLFVGPLSGRLSDQYGTIPFTTSGLAVVSVSLVLLSTVGINTPYTVLVPYLILGGAGMGLFLSPNMSSVMGSVPPHRRGVASGLRATFFNVGFTISFNIVILVLAQTIPYSLITTIISSGGNLPSNYRVAFSNGLSNVYIVLAIINAVAIVPSLLRGTRVSANSNTGNGAVEPTQDDA
jgi:EmrB/QacA subfamily drug resistance transporter